MFDQDFYLNHIRGIKWASHANPDEIWSEVPQPNGEIHFYGTRQIEERVNGLGEKWLTFVCIQVYFSPMGFTLEVSLSEEGEYERGGEQKVLSKISLEIPYTNTVSQQLFQHALNQFKNAKRSDIGQSGQDE